MTVLDLIKASLRLLGYTETPTAAQAVDAREALNLLLQTWQNSGLLALTERQSFTVASGTAEYLIGDGQTWDGTAPISVTDAVLRDSDGIDLPVEVICERDYMAIRDKSVVMQPIKLFYSRSANIGTVYLWGVPDATYTLIMLGNKPFTTYTLLTAEIELPAGYLNALKYNLAIEIAPEYEAEPSAWVIKQANDKLIEIKRPNLKKPRKISLGTVGRYDIQTDRYV